MIRGTNPHAALDSTVPAEIEAMAMAASPAITARAVGAADDAGDASNPGTVADQAGGPVASEPTPIGGEFRVNTYTTGTQQYSAIAALAGGGFVVTWSSLSQDGSSYGIYGQRYTAAGTADGSEFSVNTYSVGQQSYASVAALAGGGFVVTWTSFGQDGSGAGIYGQRFNAAGVADGSEFSVNTDTIVDQVQSVIAALAGGGFVVTWTSEDQDGSGYGIYSQRYTSTGVADGTEFRVNANTNGAQQYSAIAALADGGFVVTWSSFGQDGSSYGIYGQRYTSAGVADGSEFLVNTFTNFSQVFSSIAALADGGFVVTWTSDGQDGSSNGIYGQRYTSAGLADGSEFLVNTYTASQQVNSSVAALVDGGFVVTWASDGQDGSSYGIYGQRYTAAGLADGSEFLLNETTGGFQAQNPFPLQGLTQLADGSLVATWFGNGTGDADGVFARQFAVPAPNQAPVVDLNGAGAGFDAAASWTEGGGGVLLAPAITLSDADSATLTGATVTIGTGFVAGDLLRMSGGLSGTTASGITFSYNAGTGVMTLSGSATVADYQAALATLSFKSSNNDPGTARDITVVVNDGAASSAVAHINLAITATNDAPINGVSGPQLGNVGNSIEFAVGNGNGLTVSDADAGAGIVRVKLATDSATMILASTAGLTVTGDGTGLVIMTGTVAAINTALDGLLLWGNVEGAATLTITTNDLGNSGTGGQLIDKDTVAITWYPAIPDQEPLDGGGKFDLAGLGSEPAGAAVVFDFAGMAGFGTQAVVAERTSLDVPVQPELVVWHDPIHNGSDFLL